MYVVRLRFMFYVNKNYSLMGRGTRAACAENPSLSGGANINSMQNFALVKTIFVASANTPFEQ